MLCSAVAKARSQTVAPQAVAGAAFGAAPSGAGAKLALTGAGAAGAGAAVGAQAARIGERGEGRETDRQRQTQKEGHDGWVGNWCCVSVEGAMLLSYVVGW